MNSSAYFISDAHLGVNPLGSVPNREQALVRFMESIKGKASHLVIVGDLFEFWYEYNDYVCRNHMDLFFAMRELVKSGCEVHLLQGNHDFAYGDFFPKSLGVLTHKELKLDIQGKKVYFRHGDGVAKSDFGYRLFRRVLDFPLNRFLFRQLHPDWGMALARFVGRNSRKVGESRIIKMEEYLHWANRMLEKTGCSYCILGHHHISGIWNVEKGIVASAGDWMKKLTYLRMEAGELDIQNFEA
ncbi:UDP-2,3-diacylglucosamine diphosphatase [Fibrobacter sp. UWB5]|uniref:UDP-2,3-diacylglucosamine diphosphatase n=1 Tax=Fibrobacter sp. UWB5 TaxID=1964360 RepID=UPI000B51EA1A|nr:UDP-2,3-diacylglucosamine diphosphatase [Fibrobacter sp. UWB5]OWV13397.1 UDP-2,3-diacylglucosamine hydrolase [Fibrobacter sp. UWB5]